MAPTPYSVQILNLRWERLSVPMLERLLFISYFSAIEFAESLNMALELYPSDKLLGEMARQELRTSNLSFATWRNRRGDHWEFLQHFLNGRQPDPALGTTCREYLRAIRSLPQTTRVMSVFSREKELSGIFTKILAAPVWQTKLPVHLKALGYFFQRHIQLDSSAGGHHDLTKHLVVNDAVALFYQIRLKLYTTGIPALH